MNTHLDLTAEVSMTFQKRDKAKKSQNRDNEKQWEKKISKKKKGKGNKDNWKKLYND